MNVPISTSVFNYSLCKKKKKSAKEVFILIWENSINNSFHFRQLFSLSCCFQKHVSHSNVISEVHRCKIHRKHLRKSHFLKKVAGYRHSKELSGTVTKFVRIPEYLFYRTPLGGCFRHLLDVFIRTLCLNSYWTRHSNRIFKLIIFCCWERTITKTFSRW